jgi:antitoxin YefM
MLPGEAHQREPNDGEEFRGLLESAHLLRSPKNAVRLLTALARAERGTEAPQTIADLRRELGLDNE